jgi:hypothetical protein
LRIGNHQLTGSVQELSKPMLVCRKRPAASAETDASLAVFAFVKRKLIFKTRPQPVVSASSLKK